MQPVRQVTQTVAQATQTVVLANQLVALERVAQETWSTAVETQSQIMLVIGVTFSPAAGAAAVPCVTSSSCP